MKSNITVSGRLKLTVIDAETGKVLHVDEGQNTVLNTGIEDICYLIAGQVPVPKDLSHGQNLFESEDILPHIPLYGQFGPSGSTPTPSDASKWPNGTLDNNAIAPVTASEIVRASSFFPTTNSITIQFSLPPNKGNSATGGDVTYREAVLMSKLSVNPLKYRWFARRAFADIVKNMSTIIAAEWTITFANS